VGRCTPGCATRLVPPTPVARRRGDEPRHSGPGPPECCSLTKATRPPECGFDPANRASRVRSPRPLSSPLIAGVSDSSVARSSPERRSRLACGHASRRSQQVIDQRCVRSAICQRHFDYGHPRSRSVICRRCPPRRSSCESHWRGPADAWRVSRRPTHFGCVGL
jgi:hypothetical protein